MEVVVLVCTMTILSLEMSLKQCLNNILKYAGIIFCLRLYCCHGSPDLWKSSNYFMFLFEGNFQMTYIFQKSISVLAT